MLGLMDITAIQPVRGIQHLQQILRNTLPRYRVDMTAAGLAVRDGLRTGVQLKLAPPQVAGAGAGAAGGAGGRGEGSEGRRARSLGGGPSPATGPTACSRDPLSFSTPVYIGADCIENAIDSQAFSREIDRRLAALEGK